MWNVRASSASPELVVFTSIYDALVAWCGGHRNVVALHGPTPAETLVELVSAHGTSRLTFITTDDDPVPGVVSAACPTCEVFVATTVQPLKVLGGGAGGIGDGVRALLARSTWIGGKRSSSVGSVATRTQVSAAPVVAAPAITAAPAPTVATTDTTLRSPARTPSPTAEMKLPESADITIALGDRRWRVRGLEKNTSYDHLRVNLRVSIERADPRLSGYHVDMVELYSARQRTAFITQAAEELGVDADVLRRDLGTVLLELEAAQDKHIRSATAPKEVRPEMNDRDRSAALDVLRDPRLLDRIVADLDRAGAVGEETNKLLLYLAATSRLLDEPLAVLVQSSSSAGKSSLVDAVLGFIPEEDRVQYSAMTGQSLYYVEAGALAHKVLSIAEEEGAARAGYALKILQSEGQLTIASTAKESGTGRMVTCTYQVQGPVALCMTTTSTTIDDELQNRCLVLTVDEGQEQTRAIHLRQRERETLQGLLARRDRESVLNLHRNVQRLLRPMLVVNPHAPKLAFPTGTTRARRDHRKYLTLIRTVTLLHQHQREVKRVEHQGAVLEYIETTTGDIGVATRLGVATFGQADDLPPHTRDLLRRLDQLVAADVAQRGIDRRDYRFTRREVRERLGIGATQLWVHLKRLVEAEYLIVHPSRRGRGVVYELATTGLGAATGAEIRGVVDDLRGSFGPDSGEVRPVESATPSYEKGGLDPHRSGSSDLHDRTEPSAFHPHTLNGAE